MTDGILRSGFDRRAAIRSLAGGGLLFPGLLAELLAANPRPHAAARARRVIFVYLSGGFSHLDSFDPKPALARAAAEGRTGARNRKLLGPLWEFRRHGRCGMEVSDLFPHIGGCADDLCLVRSMTASQGNHVQATLALHTGVFGFARPSLGSWVSYGLGSERENLPSFVVLAPHDPYAGSPVWDSAFLPAGHAGRRIVSGRDPIPHLRDLSGVDTPDRGPLDLLQQMNRRHLRSRRHDPALAARMESFRQAFQMQVEAPDLFDIERESDATLDLYGLERGQTTGFGWQCLVARRLSEAGVRFVEVIDRGSSDNWDDHSDMRRHAKLARAVDRPVAALLGDLKARGLLDETLVVFTTEFGRSPTVQNKLGRSHHPKVFSSWLAGGGVKAGHVHGASDELGNEVAEGGVHTHDFHATILHLLGLDHERLTYLHGGRRFRLTDVAGKVVRELLA